MKTLLMSLAVLLVAVVMATVWLPGPLTRSFADRALARAGDLDITYTNLVADFWGRQLTFEGVQLRNPTGFPEMPAVEMTRLHARFRWSDLFGDVVRLEAVSAEVAKVVMVRSAAGATNFESMQKPRQATPEAAKQPVAGGNTPPPDEQRDANPRKRGLSIGELDVRVGTFEVVDFQHTRKDGQPQRKTYQLNLESSYENVTDLDELGREFSKKMGVNMLGAVVADAAAGGDQQALIDVGTAMLEDQLKDPKKRAKLERKVGSLIEQLDRSLNKK